jgi:hypothetical protein
MKYDEASWHYGGDYPEDLSEDAASIHIGMFLVWCLLNDLTSDIHASDLIKLKNRELTPGKWFMDTCDEKFSDQDLNQIGNSFAQYYYDLDNGIYLGDYDEILDQDLESIYHAPDSWGFFDLLNPIITKRYAQWQKQKA